MNTDLQWQLVSSNLFGGQLLDDLSYSPSIHTDVSGHLPEFSADDDLGVVEGYNPEAVVQAAWKSLTAETPKLPWERNFWDRILDPNVSATDMLERGVKRPLPAPIWQGSGSTDACGCFLQQGPSDFGETGEQSSKLCNFLKEDKVRFHCSEDQFYHFLQNRNLQEEHRPHV
jgi:hypothetical protein